MKPTELLAHLVAVAPSIALSTHWSPDPDSDIFAPGSVFDTEDPDDWQCWQSEVRASAIAAGRLVTGSDYLSDVWERFGDAPAESNPDVSGYLPQMVEEALADLANHPDLPGNLHAEIETARAAVAAEMQARYDEQQAAHA